MALCEKWQEQVLSLYDDSLNDSEAARVKQHIETCACCREEWQALLKMKEALSELPKVELPEGFREDFHARLSEEKAKASLFPKKKLHWRSYATVAAALMVFVALHGLGNNLERYRDVESEPPVKNTVEFSGKGSDTSELSDKTLAPDVSEKPTPRVATKNTSIEEKQQEENDTVARYSVSEEAKPVDDLAEAPGNLGASSEPTAKTEVAEDMLFSEEQVQEPLAVSEEETTSAVAPANEMQRNMPVFEAFCTVYHGEIRKEDFEAFAEHTPVNTISGADDLYNGKAYVKADEGLFEALSVADEPESINVSEWESRALFDGETIILIEIK